MMPPNAPEQDSDARRGDGSDGATPDTGPAAEPGSDPVDLTVIACATDEAPYLLEWISWHVLVGVARFVVYSHACRDGTDLMLDRLSQIGPLEHVPLPPPEDDKLPLRAALDEAAARPAVREARWALPLGIDEFLDITEGHGTLAELIARCDPDDSADAISIPWRIMGSHGQAAFDAAPVTARFCRGSRIAPPEASHIGRFRTLHRPAAFARLNPSRPWGAPPASGDSDDPDPPRRGKPVWRNASGDDITHAMTAQTWREQDILPRTAMGHAHASIRRYAVKSRAEFLHRQLHDTPPVEGPRGPRGWDAWLLRDINTCALPPLGPRVLRDAIGELEADDRLAELQAAARADLTRQVDGLVAAHPAARAFLDTGNTWDPAAVATEDAPVDTHESRLLCVATHPRAASLWFRRALRDAGKALGVPIVEVDLPRDLADVPETGAAILVNWRGSFPRPVFARTDARIVHIVRDPRDLLISATHHHRVAPLRGNEDLHEPRPELGGMSYQFYLGSLPDLSAQMHFEMAHRHADTAEAMLAWAYGRANTLELRYEDLVRDTALTQLAGAFEWAAIPQLDLNTMLASFWNHAIFGGMTDPTRVDKRMRRHVQSAQPDRWRTEMPRDVAQAYARRYGELLRLLDYAASDDWVGQCPVDPGARSPSDTLGAG